MGEFELILFKICKIPEKAAEIWLSTIDGGTLLRPGFWIGLKEKIDIGGEVSEVCLYHHSDGYYLIQDPLEDTH